MKNFIFLLTIFLMGFLSGIFSNNFVNSKEENMGSQQSQENNFYDKISQLNSNIYCENNEESISTPINNATTIEDKKAQLLEKRISDLMVYPPSESRNVELVERMREWASIDPKAALHWLNRLGVNNETSDLYYSVFEFYTAKYADSSIKEIDSLPEGNVKNGIIENYVLVAAKNDVVGAISWIEKLSGDHTKNNARAILLHEWARSDPQGLLDHVMLEAHLNSTERNDAIQKAASELGRKNLNILDDILTQYPEDMQPSMAAGVVASLVNENLANAKLWVESLVPGDVRDKAIQSYFKNGSRDNMENLFELAGMMRDSSKRLALLSEVVSQKGSEKPSETIKLVISSSLLNSVEKKLLIGDLYLKE